MSPKSNMKKHRRTIACVVDTETCFKNTDSGGLVYHFGAVFGNIEQTESYHVKKMDYYVLETMENIGNFLFKNKIKGKIGTFSFKNGRVIQELDIYKTENKKFIKF